MLMLDIMQSSYSYETIIVNVVITILQASNLSGSLRYIILLRLCWNLFRSARAKGEIVRMRDIIRNCLYRYVPEEPTVYYGDWNVLGQQN